MKISVNLDANRQQKYTMGWRQKVSGDRERRGRSVGSPESTTPFPFFPK